MTPILALLAILQFGPIPVPLPPLDSGLEVEGPYIFREDVGQTTKVILRNGLTAIVREQNAVPVASITILVSAGDLDEPETRAGVSRLLAHVVSNSPAERGSLPAAQAVRRLGGTLAARVDFDRTVYQTVVSARNATQGLEVMAAALMSPGFDPDALGRAQAAVRGELRGGMDDPDSILAAGLLSTAFIRHRSGRSPIDVSNALEGIGREHLVAHHETYYQPSNMILVLSGPVEREEMLTEVVRIWGVFEDAPVERNWGAPEPPQTVFRYGWERGSPTASHVALGFHVPGPGSGDVYPLEVLSAILTGGRAARLQQFLRDEDGVLATPASRYLGVGDAGFFSISMTTATPVEAERGVIEELERIRTFGVSEEELARAKVLVAGRYYRGLESVEGLGDLLAVSEARGGWGDLSRFPRGIDSVTGEEVQRVVSRYLVPGNLSVFEYVPESAEIAGTDEAFAARILGAVSANMVERTVEPIEVRARVPVFDDERIVTDLVVQPKRLSILRGPDIHVIEDPRLPLVSFGIFFPGGRLYEDADNAGITELMLRTSLRGTRRYNSAEIARRLENTGSRIEIVNEPDFFGYLLEGVTGSTREALEVLMEVLQDATFPEYVVAEERELLELELRESGDVGEERAVRTFLETLFSGTAYGRTRWGLAMSLSRLTREDVALWHRQQREVMPVIVIVGDTTGSSLVSSITDALTNEDLIERNLEGREEAPGSGTREIIEEAGFRQTRLVYGFRGPRIGDADRVPLAILGQILAGPGGRLFDSLEASELAYHVAVEGDFRIRAGAFFASVGLAPENEADVRSSIDSALRRVVEEGVSDDDLAWAREAAIGLHETSLQSRRARTMALARAVLSGAGVDSVAGYASAVHDLSAGEVNAAARQYLVPDDPTVVLLRGEMD